MPDLTSIEVSKVRLKKAEETLLSSKNNIYCLNDYDTAANRSYYAVFNAMRAVLALENFDSKKHSGVISQFRKNYINSGLLPVSLSKIIDNLFTSRTSGDYDDFYEPDKEAIIRQYDEACLFITEVKKYLDKYYSDMEEVR